jgi:hypothetical protein
MIIHNYCGDNVRSLRWVAVVATNMMMMMIMAVAPIDSSEPMQNLHLRFYK